MDYAGTSGNDILDQASLGLPSGTVLLGLAGNDTLSSHDLNMVGGEGNDMVIGLGTFATAAYWYSPQGVRVDLQAGTALDGLGGTDTLVDILSVHGSSFADVLLGSDADEWFHGHGGNDTIDGGGGFDVAQFIFSDPAGYSYAWDATLNALRVTDIRPSDGNDGSVLLSGIERMVFQGTGRESQGVDTSMYRPSAWSLAGTASYHVGDGAVGRYAVGDFNGDGTPDLVMHFTPAATFTPNLPAAGPVSFWTVDSSGAYIRATGVVDDPSPVLSSEFAVADFNGDGVADPVLFAAGRDPYVEGIPTGPAGGYPGEEPYIWLSGAGRQALVNGVFPTTFGHHGSVGDIDGDGDVDIYVSSISVGSAAPFLLINKGAGSFTVNRTRLPDAVVDSDTTVLQTFGNGTPKSWVENRFTASALLDANGDGALDLALLPAAGSGAARIYLNDGGGNFDDARKWTLPASPYGSGVASRETQNGSVAFDGPVYLDTVVLDFNGDGKMDLVAIVTENQASGDEWVFYRGTTVQFFQNTGTGFIDVTAQRTDFAHEVSGNQLHYDQIDMADVDQDGFTDLLVQRGPDGQHIPSTRILHNDGNGFFADRSIDAGVNDGILVPVDPAAGILLSVRNSHVLGYDANGIPDAVIDVDTMRFDFAAGRDYFTGEASGAVDFTSAQAGRWLHGTQADNSITLSSGDEKGWGYGGDDVLRGMGGNDTLDGGDGIDTAVYAGARSTHTIAAGGVEVSGGADGVDVLVSVERLQFDDVRLAFDLTGHAGIVARLLGAVFGAPAVHNAGLVGIGLQFVDGGLSYVQAAELALNARLGAGATDAQVVDLLYANVMGMAPDAATQAVFTGMIAHDGYTQASLAVLAAETGLNALRIGMPALADGGLLY